MKKLSVAYQGSVTNDPAANDFLRLLGGLVVNAGHIELLVDILLIELSPTPVDPAELRKSTFSQRSRQLREIAGMSHLGAETVAEIDRVLCVCDDLMKSRNIVAHGPLAFAYERGAESGPPKAIGILDMKGTRATLVPFLSVEGLRRLVDGLWEAARNLETIRHEIGRSDNE